MIDLIVTLQVKPGMEAKVEDLMRQLEQETAENDPGCLRYQWYSAHEQPCLYYLLERYNAAPLATRLYRINPANGLDIDASPPWLSATIGKLYQPLPRIGK